MYADRVNISQIGKFSILQLYYPGTLYWSSTLPDPRPAACGAHQAFKVRPPRSRVTLYKVLSIYYYKPKGGQSTQKKELKLCEPLRNWEKCLSINFPLN